MVSTDFLQTAFVAYIMLLVLLYFPRLTFLCYLSMHEKLADAETEGRACKSEYSSICHPCHTNTQRVQYVV